MGTSSEINYSCPKAFPSSKIIEVETTLQKTITQFKDIVKEFEELHIENENFRKIQSQKEKCDVQTCPTCEDLKKDLINRKMIFESVVSALNKLQETKDLNILDAIFKLIYKEGNNIDILTPPKDNSMEKQDTISPKKEDSNENESMVEIEGTPTGNTSPIMMAKKRNTSRQSSVQDKKKCSELWPTSEAKSVKLSFPTPTKGQPKLRQSRLGLVKLKTTCVVDLTCSPEAKNCSQYNVKNIKKEVFDNEETILPSPTSGPVHFQSIQKSFTKDSFNKYKQAFITKLDTSDDNKNQEENKMPIKDIDVNKIELSASQECIDKFKKPIKREKRDETYCADESISLLQRVANIDNKTKSTNSPIKRPLVENVNVVNTQHSQASMSILKQELVPKISEVGKRVKSNVETCLEATLQKKCEILPTDGVCDKCKSLLVIYKDNQDMVGKVKENCHKKHKINLRPKTPEGFWNPRWDVPEDTEEFNRRNNAL